MSAGWVVVKFGGTSVSTAERWATIGRVASERVAEGFRPLIVCSALSGISNLLERVAVEAPAGPPDARLAEIEGRHRQLGVALGVDVDALLGLELAELSRLALGASLVGETSPRLHARIMATGELLSTRLGVAFLRRIGLDVAWVDARQLLVAEGEEIGRAHV